MQRLMRRDKLTQTTAQDRLSAQMRLADKLPYADRVIDNSGGQQELVHQVDVMLFALRRQAGWTWRLFWWFPPLALIVACWSIVKRNTRFGLSRRGKKVLRAQD